MTKSGLIERLAERLRIPKGRAEQVVNCIFETMTAALERGDRIEIRGFGTFTVKAYGGYVGRNPRTGEPLEVSEKRLPRFRPGKDLRELLRQLEPPPGADGG